MGPNQRQFEREEEAIWKAEARGEISNKEAWEEQKELQRSYHAEAEEAAMEAYHNELEHW